MTEDEKAIWNAAFGAAVAQVWALDVAPQPGRVPTSWAEALHNLDKLDGWVVPLPAAIADKAVEIYQRRRNEREKL
jgi:hypothetical protein